MICKRNPYSRIPISLVINDNQIPVFLEQPIRCSGYQVRYITFKNVPADAVGSLFQVSCPQLSAIQTTPVSIIQNGPTSTQRFTDVIVSLPQSLINVTQDYPIIFFREDRWINTLKMAVGNEVTEYDATSINAFSRFTIVIDFLQWNPCNCDFNKLTI